MEKKKALNEMEYTLQVIGGKYKLLILHYLKECGKASFSDIVSYLSIAPKKTIVLSLKELEIDQILIREVISTKPLRVNYYVSKYGESLFSIIDLLCDWGYEHIKDNVELIHPICI